MIVTVGELGQPRFLRWHIAPFLHNWLLHLPWVGSCPCTDLLGNIHTLLSRSKFGHQLGHVLAGTLGLQRTLFLGPLGALCICCVARCFIFTLLLHYSLTCNN